MLQKATMRGLNKVSQRVKTQATRALAKQMGLPQKRVRAEITIRKASNHSLDASVNGTGRPIKLIHYKARQLKKGAAASPWGNRKKFPGTFIPIMLSGHKDVFKRKRSDRLPLLEFYGPSVPR